MSIARKASLIVLLTLFAGVATAQDIVRVPFSSAEWRIEGEDAHLVLYKGFEAIRLQGAEAWLDDVGYRTGTIEFDIAFPLERGFQGVRWRAEDGRNFEEFYLRSHLSGKPDANQYTPVIAGLAGWQLYFGDHYSAPIRYTDDWMHVRIVVADEMGDVYVDSDEPVLTFRMKGVTDEGGLGVYASALVPAYFANFAYRFGEESLRGSYEPFPDPEPGTVLSWEVAEPFEESELGDAALPESFVSDRMFTDLWAEESGITNLARAGLESEARTTLARVRFESTESRIIPVSFGYSDRVRVYLNGDPCYTGDNGYVTRDYRYLGTIGYFDTLPLHVSPGENELIFAVSEDFGGWGVTARFLSTDGLTFAEGTVQR